MSRVFNELADLYDQAFSWDAESDARWLLERFGPPARCVLEPGCGSGRMFPALARLGAQPIGVDLSRTMLERARCRMRDEGLPPPPLVHADMARFRLGRPVDGAYCPIGTLGYLGTFERTATHLESVAAHLRPGGRYMVQLDLADLRDHRATPPDRHSQWEVDGPSGRLRCSCFGRSWDADRRIEVQVCRFEVLSGADAGTVHEGADEVLLWDWASWRRLVDGSPFRQAAAYDGRAERQYSRLEVGPALQGIRLAWHELQRR